MRLHDFLDYQAREHPDEEFAVQGDRRLTYREALAEANRLANAFVSAGLQIGDRIAVLSKNNIEYAILYYGASKAGVVPVPLNYRLAPGEWTYIINDAGAKLLIAADDYAGAIDGIRSELKTVERFVGVNIEGMDGVEGWEDYGRWAAGQSAEAPERAAAITDEHDVYQMY